MRHITEAEYKIRLEQAKEQNLSKERKRKLREVKNNGKRPIKLPSTSKIVLWAVFIINIEIVWFVEWAIIKWGDLSSLYALIAVPATMVPTIWGYYIKSKAENTSGGIIYDSAMMQYAHNADDNEDAGRV